MNVDLKLNAQSVDKKLAEQYYDVSLYYATIPNYYFGEMPISMNANISLGSGVELFNPYDPIVKAKLISFNAPSSPALETKTLLNGAQVRTTITWDYFSDKSVSEKADALYANFGFDGGLFGSFDASFSFVEKYSRDGVFIMAQGTYTETDPTAITQPPTIIPEQKMLLDKIDKLPNIIERSSKFFDTYGSHYVSQITKGYRFTFVARSESAKKEIEKTANAKFQNMVANFSVSASDKQFFADNNILISATIVCGNIDKPYIFCASIDEISSFLSKLNNGEIKIGTAPISCRLTSYNHVIFSNDYPNLYSLTSPNLGDRASSDFGVPKGTVISWYPPDLAVIKRDKVDIRNIVPKGWALCDGTQGTPDLRKRFIYGAINTFDIDSTGGSETHDHGGRTGTAVGGTNYSVSPKHNPPEATGTDHYHSISSDFNIPPFTMMVYIMKL